ncbi:MHJ_0274 family protein [Mycoplasmopsis cricetuli]|uniref:MHJ_0274 family protein n=1 Tax=Mycoplasmopsis cricetuli TaxID=171283 RepID=UPI00046F0267|nr:hypothetical protein [Mycoplasmopsis cricetuli]
MNFLSGNNLFVYIILGALVLAVLGFVIWQNINNKLKKRKQKRESDAFENDSREYVNYLIVEINEIINLTKHELNNFQVSIGSVKMSDINLSANALLNDIVQRDKFKRYVLSNPNYSDFVLKISALKDAKANLWENKFEYLIDYFKDKLKTIEVDLSSEKVKQEIEYVQNSYNFQINNRIEMRKKNEIK